MPASENTVAEHASDQLDINDKLNPKMDMSNTSPILAGAEAPPAELDDQDDQDQDKDEEEDYDDIFADDECENYDYASFNPSDLTKSYNRQRRLQEILFDPGAPKSSFPKANPQKPVANTFASVDDQISTLSRYAWRLKLDDQQSGLGGKTIKLLIKATVQQANKYLMRVPV